MSLPPLFREKFALAMRALSESRSCLPLQRFVEVVADHDMEKSAEVAALVAPQLPGIYTRLVTDGEFPGRVKASRYGAAQAAAPPRFAQWAQKHAADLSFTKRHVYDRVTRAALRHVEPKMMVTMGREKLASDRGPTERLAEEYAMYKLAFLGSLPESDPDFQLTASLAILQNYAA